MLPIGAPLLAACRSDRGAALKPASGGAWLVDNFQRIAQGHHLNQNLPALVKFAR
jgi:hypothetical protein